MTAVSGHNYKSQVFQIRRQKMQINGIVFDKDGTLLRFCETWNVWCEQVITELAKGDVVLRGAIAQAIDYDLNTCSFRPESIVIAGTTREISQTIVSLIPDMAVAELEAFLNTKSTTAPLAEVTPLKAFLNGLTRSGIKTGVVTNDSEESAVSQLKQIDVLNELNFIAGYDSGFGAKPSSGPLLAFAKAVSLPPETIAMVGDSLHDMVAGRRAGMKTIAVLTGLADRNELASHADVILEDITKIPAYLGLNDLAKVI
jgi:phosphoglycolate phosphatase